MNALEKTADEYKFLVYHIIDSKDSLSKDALLFYDQVNLYYNQVYDLFYNFDLDKCAKNFCMAEELLDKYLLLRKRNHSDVIALSYLRNVILNITDIIYESVNINFKSFQ